MLVTNRLEIMAETQTLGRGVGKLSKKGVGEEVTHSIR
jgi:hypothetical protein